ncbi:Z1 domain-containing protein [Embleya sp. NPDC005971]|uniref:Z1 domain-containing protein n=1 Tax=unclassified Embleya TaxID=2699296 RepID=UPI0033C3EF77
MTSEPASLALQFAESMLLKVAPRDRTQERIREIAGQVQVMMSTLKTEVSPEQIARELESRFDVWVPREISLLDPQDHDAWLNQRRYDVEWAYWERYKTWLSHESGWKPPAVEALDEATDTVLGLMEDPMRPGEWRSKGLVYGQVQSGKTANYTGLICKAVDAGYRAVIVMTGAHESLRHQTQARLDAEFLGFNTSVTRQRTAESKYIGVGTLDMKSPPLCLSITSRDKDFQSAVFRSTPVDLRQVRLLAVVKKNARILDNLAKWLGDFAKGTPDGRLSDLPVLVIDDEADYASVDTKRPRYKRAQSDPEHDPTRINQAIRKLLGLFEKRTYVAYSATPFANIFISPETDHPTHGEDLFPESFMVALKPPSNYTGPEVVFGLVPEDAAFETHPLPVHRPVTDHEGWIPEGHAKGWVPPRSLPASLDEALDAFVLSTAARRARAEIGTARRGHATMLVHVTRFTDVQTAVVRQLSERLREMDEMWPDRGEAGARLRARLRSLWERDFLSTREELTATHGHLGSVIGPAIAYDRVEAHVQEVLSDAAEGVKAVNGQASDVLEYESSAPATVVAVGGDKLSRGLTLEGLSVSYYLRASRTYDTLLQMGRWFGYRPGYLDVTRLYTTPELVKSYVHVTRANRELMDLISVLAETGSRPRDVGLRIRDGHEHLQVTAAAKMRNTRSIWLTFAERRAETLHMLTRPDALRGNKARLDALIDAMTPCAVVPPELRPPDTGQGFMRRNVPARAVIDFLDGFACPGRVSQANPRNLIDYIHSQNAHGELVRWTVAITGGSSKQRLEIAGESIRQVRRKPVGGVVEAGLDFEVGVLVSPVHEAIGLTRDQYDDARRMTNASSTSDEGRLPPRRSPSRETRPSGRELRRRRDPAEGLLLIYPIETTGCVTGVPEGLPLVGYAVSFPSSPTARPLSYRVTETYLRELVTMLTLEDEDPQGDDRWAD